MDNDTKVCLCGNVSAGQIRQAVAGGACTLGELRERLPVAVGCCRCMGTLRELLEECPSLAYPLPPAAPE
jgi:nitrite reductase (NADH) large subunit